MAQKTVVMITGGNSGFGYAVAEELIMDATKHILLACRSAEKGEKAVEQLRVQSKANLDFVELDVSDEKSIETASKLVEREHGRLDILINNAAVIDEGEASLSKQMAQCFLTNSTGVVLVVEAFLPLLQKSTCTPRIINISSGAGSLGRRVSHTASTSRTYGMKGVAYAASKAALNMITLAQAHAFGAVGLKVFAYTPGFVVSNLTSLNSAANGAKSPKGGAEGLVRIVNGERDEEHGCFLSEGGQYAW